MNDFTHATLIGKKLGRRPANDDDDDADDDGDDDGFFPEAAQDDDEMHAARIYIFITALRTNFSSV